jgi:la-related protein 1
LYNTSKVSAGEIRAGGERCGEVEYTSPDIQNRRDSISSSEVHILAQLKNLPALEKHKEVVHQGPEFTMSSTSSRLVGDGAPPPPVFSYAQAAKGRPASTVASTIQSSQTNTSGVSTPARDPSSVIHTPSGGSERGDRSVNGSHDVSNKVDVSRDGSISDSKTTKPKSTPASPSFGTASTSTLPKEERDDDFVLVGSTSSDSARDRHVLAVEKPVESAEGRKGKKSKKQKNAEKETEKEKEKEEAKPEVLVPAPLPAVNFWQQRKEELAKAKPTPILVQISQSSAESSTLNDAISTVSTKPGEGKKRGKASITDDGDKSMGAKDASMGRAQKKSGEGVGKAKEDQPNKRAAPRGSRMGEKEEKSISSQVPPPVEDAISWPTPETALEEEKRKAHEKSEKEEKDENSSNKPRPKEKWVPVPYIPTVTFNTPLPTRGGRGRGGARGGRTEGGGRPSHANGSAVGEKAQNTASPGNPSVESELRQSRDSPRAASLPPNSKKSNEPSSRDHRKPSAQTMEKSRSGPTKAESSSATEGRSLSGASVGLPDGGFESSQDQQRGENVTGFKSDQLQNDFHEGQSLAGSNGRKPELNLRGSDQFKEGTVLNRENNSQSRERSDVRSDRGRGGFRGRGNHSNYPNGQSPLPQHIFTNGHPSQPLNGYSMRQASGPYSPPLQPPPFSNQYAPAPSRGGRGGSRSQSIPNNSMYGRFPNGGPIPQHMGPLQTSQPMFEYPPPQSMSAVPYTSYIDYPSLIAMVTMQIEYYFSIDNLCKDVFLRKHMDSQGFVFLNFIAGFKRIQSLTQEFDTLRYACQESEIIDFVRGEDGFDRLRRKEGWEKWVLAMEERDESVRNGGPAFFQRPQPIQRPQQMSMFMPSHHSMSPPAFSPNGTESSFRPFGNGTPVVPITNGNGAYHPETPLSAAVPDFSPGLLPLNGPLDPLEAEVTFQDDEVAHLTVVFTLQRSHDDPKTKTPFHNASARTFSNGSIDGRSIAEGLHDNPRQGRTLTNGSRAAET